MKTVFIYGSLKRGKSNSRMMIGQKFVCEATTVPEYALFDCGRFPGLVHIGNGGKSIKGELWEISDTHVSILDRFEGVPYLYKRKDIKLSSHPTLAVQTYIFQGNTKGLDDCGESWN